ncbi:MAG: hypothetical protein K5777_04730 [Nitrosopumilus sp.]|nr:hypothetical protein [Nitrosopumilus sp.]
MNKNFILFGILASILMGGSFGLFSINDSFGDDDPFVSREDSDDYKKQLEKDDEQKEKSEERRKELEKKKNEQKEKSEERRKELEKKKNEQKEKSEERRKELEKKKNEQKEKSEERRKELEERKIQLDSDRKELEKKLSEKLNEHEKKLNEIKEKYQNKIESGFMDDVDKLSKKMGKLENEFNKKSEEIRKKLLEKQEKLDSRTQKILEKITNGEYLGDKLSSSSVIETYELTFDSVTATGIHDKTQSSTLEGFMIFKTFDKGKSNLKLELQECTIVVDDVPFNCGFGKARTTSSGDSGSKDSLVILAFLEDDILEEVHSTLKISLNSDSPIREIDGSSQVSILTPQSKISGMWFLDGTGTLSKTILPTDETTDKTTGNQFTIELSEEIGITGN